MAVKEEGKKNKVYIMGLSESGTWSDSLKIEGQTESSLNISNSLQQVESTKDDSAGWVQQIDGDKSWGLSVSFMRNQESTDNTKQRALLTAMLASDTGLYAIQGEWRTEDSTTKFYGAGGKVKMASLNTNYPKDSNVNATAELTGNGALVDLNGKTASEIATALSAL